MRIKFKAKTMPKYIGADGNGGSIELRADDEADVSEAVGKILCQRFAGNFEQMPDAQPEHAPDADKLYRKSPKTKTK